MSHNKRVTAINELGQGGVDAAKLAQAEKHTAGLLQGLRVAVEAYPDPESLRHLPQGDGGDLRAAGAGWRRHPHLQP